LVKLWRVPGFVSSIGRAVIRFPGSCDCDILAVIRVSAL
jgi:hypothetical protein